LDSYISVYFVARPWLMSPKGCSHEKGCRIATAGRNGGQRLEIAVTSWHYHRYRRHLAIRDNRIV